MNDTQKAILKGLLESVPQAQAISMIADAVDAKSLGQQIIQKAALQSLTTEQQAAVEAIMSLDKDGRTALASEIIGSAVATKAQGFFSKIFNALFGWMK